jgi:lysine-ketoglutarate reductase/saccharopine dehydrogenase-like protein (TIGR00300 family)
MDCGIAVDVARRSARCVPMIEVEVGMAIVTGHAGVRVVPLERPRETTLFGFMGSNVSSEKPKSVSLQAVADSIRATRAEGKKVLLVGGPAIVHTGSAEHVAQMVREGWVQTLFAGNALATHDIEQALYGTSLGVSIARGEAIEHGHEHHLRAINAIRRLGGIKPAVAAGVLTSGIMYECARADVDLVLAGSIRDDGPLPDVISDTLRAQSEMRRAIHGVGFALMIATALHSIATGNLLPAWVKVVCVDINPATVTKLSDRGTFQTIGLVTDVEPFLRSLAAALAVETH